MILPSDITNGIEGSRKNCSDCIQISIESEEVLEKDREERGLRALEKFAESFGIS